MPNTSDRDSDICERCFKSQNRQSDEWPADEEMKLINSLIKRTINEIPEEVLQYILSLIPPYRDIKQCRLVCRKWQRLTDDLINRRKNKFIKALRSLSLKWQKCSQEPWPVVAARYSPAFCYYKDCLYVFGGNTNNNTSFNDLWKFDLGNRRWIRPLVTGTYPIPKAYATFVHYENQLILFGGLNNPPLSAFDQSVRLNNQVHLYDVMNNIWTELDVLSPPSAVAAHSATVHGHSMVVFGGHRFLTNSNEIWVLDLKNPRWWQPETNSQKPEPRYGHTQVRLDDYNLLVIGGCGGPNKILSDVWLLTISKNEGEAWTWKKMLVKNPSAAAPHIWCRTGCKVENHVVFLGEFSELRSISMSPIGRLADWSMQTHRDRAYSWRANPTQRLQSCSGIVIPPENTQLLNSVIKCRLCGCPLADRSESAKSTNLVRNTVMPSIKPNSMKNRQRQLEGCQRMEQRIRQLSKSSSSHSNDNANTNDSKSSTSSLMAMYLLDLSFVMEKGEVEWTMVPDGEMAGSPPRALLYSMVYSGFELVVFGGILKSSTVESFDNNSNKLSNSVYTLSYKSTAM
ncbi:hypothetical protein CHUAL_001205 [Chamberlinius hualienensis]